MGCLMDRDVKCVNINLLTQIECIANGEGR